MGALREGRKPKPGPPGDEEEDAALNAELNAIGNNPTDDVSQPESAQPAQPFEEKQPAQPSYQQPMQPMQPSQPQYNAPMQPQPMAQPYQQPMQPMANAQPMQPQGGSGQTGQNGLGGYYVNNAPQYNYQQRVQLPTFEKKVEACVEAEKTLKEAMAALRFEDVDTAIKKSQEAIAILQPHNR